MTQNLGCSDSYDNLFLDLFYVMIRIKKVRICFYVAIVLSFLIGCTPSPKKPISAKAQNEELKVCVIDVGHGDAVLIIFPNNKYLLIDGGNTGKGNARIIPLLDSLKVTHLDYVVASHYDADHIGGLDEVINHIGRDSIINYCYDGGGIHNSSPFTQYITSIGSKRKTIIPGEKIVRDDVTITCVCVDGKLINGDVITTKNINDSSVGLIVKYKNFKLFTAGDLSGKNTGNFKDIESKLASLVGDIDVYKVSHHGSKYSSNQVFISTIKPEASIISVGKNTYGHPNQEIINRLLDVKSRIYQTDSSSYGHIPSGKGKIIKGNVWIRVYNDFYIVNTDTFNLKLI